MKISEGYEKEHKSTSKVVVSWLLFHMILTRKVELWDGKYHKTNFFVKNFSVGNNIFFPTAS